MKSSKIVVNIMVAIAISLVVNFSHLMLALIEQDQYGEQPYAGRFTDSEVTPYRGVVALSSDGHGYVISKERDSAYLAQNRVARYNLKGGDSVVVAVVAAQNGGTHPVAVSLLKRNGRKMSLGSDSAPRHGLGLVAQLIYFFLLSLIVVMVITSSLGSAWWRSGLAILIAVALYFVAPVNIPRHPEVKLMFMSRHIIDYMVVLKWSFALIVSLLYGRIYSLISDQHAIMIENEALKSENIKSQYNILMSQISPHFLFNSLNSLSMLVREGESNRSLTYIDQLSYIFRYTLQSGERSITTLGEEMRFAKAYIYLFNIRYADKLFFDIDIPEEYLSWKMPSLTLQPLLDNAVKHNTITRSNPFHVTIKIENGALVIYNPKHPKLDKEPSTGIGLKNLSQRWELLTHSKIVIKDATEHFAVTLPIINPMPKSL